MAVVNQKGGVGKTTTAINLSTALAAAGKRVMLFDLDPQGNASTGMGIDRNAADTGSYEVLIDGASLAEAAVATAVPGLVVVPASSDLTGAELGWEEIDGGRRVVHVVQARGATYSDRTRFPATFSPVAAGMLRVS